MTHTRRTPGGYGGLENPALDSRIACPRWLPNPPSVLRLTDAIEEGGGAPFSLWKLQGRKSLLHEGEHLLLTVDDHPRLLRLELSNGISDGRPINVLLPVSAQVRACLPGLTRLIALLQQHRSPPRKNLSCRPTRRALVHMRALQALDGEAAGATHRDIASALFGDDEVFQRWETNSELRAQVRYLLRRGHGLMNGGYWDLLGTRASKREGDFTARSDSP